MSNADAHEKAVTALLAARNPHGYWTGELACSALATATAVSALAVLAQNSNELRTEIPGIIEAGLDWLAANQNQDGGWGDTIRSFSNLSTTTLVWAAFGVKADDRWQSTIGSAENWLRSQTGSLDPVHLIKAITSQYGNDRTFSIPILTLCAITGRLGPVETAWKHIIQLPFELAVLPARWFGVIRLPVVSYALPALIAIGQVRHHFRPSRNPVLRWVRTSVSDFTLRLLTGIQPVNGGFLEATPLTAFVTISLAAMGLTRHPVVQRGVNFLVNSAKPDGSWAIDTNLSTWVTTLAVQALGDNVINTQPIREWLLRQQYRVIHPYTQAAPGGWAWTDLPGGVPDADDTAGALLALRRLGPLNSETRHAAIAGVQWLVNLQNRDGGIPTFCKGWGTLPFDRSSPDITAHAIRAWIEWLNDLPAPDAARIQKAISKAVRFLEKTQRPDGAWIPLWFGHQESINDENPVYGTSRILLGLKKMIECNGLTNVKQLALAGERWLVANQNPDGGWAGKQGASSSIEETGLALEALAVHQDNETAIAVQNGTAWLAAKINAGLWNEAAPIGFYFARLWYYEKLYPLIFATAALKAVATREGIAHY